MIAHPKGGLRARALLILVALVLLLPLGEPQAEQVGLQVSPSETPPEVGFLAPDFTLEDLSGRRVRLSEYRGNRVVFLYFWTTWCQACEFEMHSLEVVYRRLKRAGPRCHCC